MATANEVMSKRVHKMKQSRGAMRIPPCRSKSIEVRDFRRIDRRGGAMNSELVLHESGSSSEKQVEISERCRTKRRSHYSNAGWYSS